MGHLWMPNARQKSRFGVYRVGWVRKTIHTWICETHKRVLPSEKYLARVTIYRFWVLQVPKTFLDSNEKICILRLYTVNPWMLRLFWKMKIKFLHLIFLNYDRNVVFVGINYKLQTQIILWNLLPIGKIYRLYVCTKILKKIVSSELIQAPLTPASRVNM